MKARCHNPNSPDFEAYGARAISVTKTWRDSFEAFLDDMGVRPDGTTLDRIDGRFGYFAANCRWATMLEQTANRYDVTDRPAFVHPKLISESDPRVAAYRIWR